jgi:hypothetical protein
VFLILSAGDCRSSRQIRSDFGELSEGGLEVFGYLGGDDVRI